MSKKDSRLRNKKRLNKSNKTHRDETRRELEGLIKTCHDAQDVAIGILQDIIVCQRDAPEKINIDGSSDKHAAANFIRLINKDIVDLDEELKEIKRDAREVTKNYTTPEDNLIDNIEISQRFEDWHISFESNVSPALLELASYIKNDDVESCDEPTTQTTENNNE